MLDPVAGPVHVTVSGTAGRKGRTGVHLHRSSYLTNTDTTRRYGIAVTTPARTIRDLRRTVSPKLVRRAIRQAEFDRLPIEEHAVETAGTRSDSNAAFFACVGATGCQNPR
jgi:DNA helicase IV